MSDSDQVAAGPEPTANIHAAEASQHSTAQPPPPFLRLPAKIRLSIYCLILKKGGDNRILIKFALLKKTRPEYDRGYGLLRIDAKSGLAIGDSAEPFSSILRTCRKVHEETVEVLYGENKFESRNARGLSDIFIPMIGANMATPIKDLVLGVPRCVIEADPGADLTKFIDLVCGKLSGLQTLRIVTYCRRPQDLPSNGENADLKDLWKHDRRALLCTASLVTANHPILKRAIWSGESHTSGWQWGRRIFEESLVVIALHPAGKAPDLRKNIPHLVQDRIVKPGGSVSSFSNAYYQLHEEDN